MDAGGAAPLGTTATPAGQLAVTHGRVEVPRGLQGSGNPGDARVAIDPPYRAISERGAAPVVRLERLLCADPLTRRKSGLPTYMHFPRLCVIMPRGYFR